MKGPGTPGSPNAGAPIGTYPHKVKVVRRPGPIPELSVCSIYGHCYCGDKSANSKPHVVCCMCGHQRSSDGARFAESLKRERVVVNRCGTDLSRMIFD